MSIWSANLGNHPVVTVFTSMEASKIRTSFYISDLTGGIEYLHAHWVGGLLAVYRWNPEEEVS